MNMKLPEVVTHLSIYNGCSTRKTFWEEISTLMKMKNCVNRNVKKHRDIKDGDNYIALDISLGFFSLYKMKITYSEPKYYLGGSREELIASLGLKTIIRSKKKKRQGMPLLMSV